MALLNITATARGGMTAMSIRTVSRAQGAMIPQLWRSTISPAWTLRQWKDLHRQRWIVIWTITAFHARLRATLIGTGSWGYLGHIVKGMIEKSKARMNVRAFFVEFFFLGTAWRCVSERFFLEMMSSRKRWCTMIPSSKILDAKKKTKQRDRWK
jgi:hypothetical protein